ncbi:MAG TPA: aminotransferase class V-fold PLP-dependent enzyme [Flavipsychrobacter sp.]
MQHIYFNTAAAGLIPAAFTEEAGRLYASFTDVASTYAEKWRDETQPLIRTRLAQFLSAPVANVVFLPNFSWGINGIVHSLKGTEKVMLYKGDYPSLLDPFKINRFDISWIEDTDGFTIPVDEMKQRLLDEKTDILAISHVQWMSAFKFDLEDIGAFCRQQGIKLIVDATQSMGAVHIDLSVVPVDVLIASNYKWMNAGFGTGVMYISDDFMQEYPPAVAGFNSYTFSEGKPQYIPGARSFEPGHTNMYGLLVMDAAIQHKMQMGVPKIEEHNTALTQLFLDDIKDAGLSVLGGYSTNNRASYVLLKDENGLGELLKKNGVVVTHRAGMLRLSFHYYNTAHEVRRVTDIIRNS